MDQEVDFDQYSDTSLNSDSISSNYSYKSDKILRSISSLSLRSATSSRLEYVHELSFLFKKIHRDLKFDEVEEAYTISATKQDPDIFDWTVFVKLLLQIIEGLIEKLEYILCLGPMLKDRNLIFSHLGCADTEKVYDILRATRLERGIPSHVISPQMMEVIRILLSSSGLIKEAPRYRDKMHSNSKKFLDLFKEFYRIMTTKCEMIAPKEILKDKMFHEMFRNNHRICEKIREIEESIKREQAKVEVIIKSKTETVQEYRNKLDLFKKNFEIDIHSQIQESQKEMNAVYETSKIEQAQLSNQVQKVRKQYNDILMENLRMENEIRERKGIVQQQLRTWLNRYDKDIGERTEQLADLEKRKAQRQKEFDEWEIEFITQETEYIALMAKKEMEEKKRIEEKLLMFLMNRSAIIIQRAWRKFLGRRKKSKKKGKKGKK